jgi:hypothetical protein
VRFNRLWDGLPTTVYRNLPPALFQVPAGPAPGAALPPFDIVIPFTTSFPWQGGPLAIELVFAPTAGTSTWRVDSFVAAAPRHGSSRSLGAGCRGTNSFVPFHYAMPETTMPGAQLEVQVEGLPSNGLAADDYELVVNATFEHLDVASWLAEKLLLEFVTDRPSAALIANLATVIRDADYEMKPVLRRLFLSDAFHVRKREMIRMPIDFGIGLVRATGLMVTPEVMRAELLSLAQVPGEPPSVFGWPQGEQWLSAAGMVERANLVRRVIAERTYQTNNGFAISMPAGTPDASAVVDHFASLGFGFDDFLVHVHDLPAGFGIDGLLWLSFLKRFNYEIRSVEGRIRVEIAA